jgi:fibronectin-binding autotransporter adhesin
VGSGRVGVCTSGVGARLELIDSVVQRNDGEFGGGVEIGSGNGLIVDTTIAENTATGDGGGIFASVAQPLVVRSSTISGNRAAGAGGGVRAERATELIVKSSTVAENEANGGGGDILAENPPAGGNPTVVELEFATIARNTADLDGGGTDSGGGIASGLDASYRSHGSLIALNAPDDCVAAVTSQGRNLLSDDFGCDIFDGPGDLVSPTPKLGELERNGGPTRTIEPKRRSPAVDSGGRECPNRDQRGVRRPKGPNCDIGAIERER